MLLVWYRKHPNIFEKEHLWVYKGKWRPNSSHHPTSSLKAYVHLCLWHASYAIFHKKVVHNKKTHIQLYTSSSGPRISFTLALCSISTVWIFRCTTAAAHSSVVDVNLLRGFSLFPSCWKSWGKSFGRISWDKQWQPKTWKRGGLIKWDIWYRSVIKHEMNLNLNVYILLSHAQNPINNEINTFEIAIFFHLT